MAYNLKVNNVLNSISKSIQDYNIDASDFVTRANDTSMVIQNGIIESLYIIGDGVFAVIRKDIDSSFTYSGDQIDHGDGWFNGTDRIPIDNTTVSELSILTNIDASNNQLNRYIEKPCEVVVKNDIAVYASVNLGFPSISTVPSNIIRKIRIAIADVSDDIFSDVGRKLFKEEGYTDQDINALSDFKYVADMYGKLNTFEGEAYWFKDTSQQSKDENILKANDILVGLKKLGMKSKNCHRPSRIFSGK